MPGTEIIRTTIGPVQRRIAWFLSLRSASGFSSPSLAPVLSNQRQNVSKRYALPLWARSQAGSTAKVGASQRGGASGSAGGWTLPKSVPEPRKVRINGSLGAPAALSARSNTSKFVLALARGADFVDMKTGAPGADAARQQQSALPFIKSRFHLHNESKLSFGPDADGGLASTLPVAPLTSNSIRNQGSLQPVAKRANVLPVATSFPGDDFRSSGDQVWQSHANSSDQNERSSTETNALGGNVRTNTGGAATIHLDGAALGRWTIQHVEQALSKSTNSMTGVDPRATMPRGHVSPF